MKWSNKRKIKLRKKIKLKYKRLNKRNKLLKLKFPKLMKMYLIRRYKKQIQQKTNLN